jgi:hypothetical protein
MRFRKEITALVDALGLSNILGYWTVDGKPKKMIGNGTMKYLDWTGPCVIGLQVRAHTISPSQSDGIIRVSSGFWIGSDRRHKKLSSPLGSVTFLPLPWYTMLQTAATAAAPDYSCSRFLSSRLPAPPPSLLLLARRRSPGSSRLSLRRHGAPCHCRRCRCHASWSCSEHQRRDRSSRGRHCR